MLPELGLPDDRMPEAEVALRLAEFILSLPGSGAMASVAIDGASIKVGNAVIFDIGRFMAGTGWEQTKEPQVGRNAWTGAYRRGDKTIRVHSRPGEGDVVATVDGRRIVAECKKGPLVRKARKSGVPAAHDGARPGAAVRRLRRRHRGRGRAGHACLPQARGDMAEPSTRQTGRHPDRPRGPRRCGFGARPVTGTGCGGAR